MDWQSIETAPRDGSILLWWPRYTYSLGDETVDAMLIGRWKENDRIASAKRRGEDIRGASVGYFSDNGEFDDYGLALPEHAPTHWMPLPAPPTRDGKTAT